MPARRFRRTKPTPAMTSERRVVTLRDERQGEDERHLWAYLDERGALHIDGQDLGPGTAMVSGDAEYEWFKTIAASRMAKVIALLDGRPGDDVLDLLERNFTGTGSYDLEARLRNSNIPVDFHSC